MQPPLRELDTNAAINRAAERVKNATANVRRLVDIEKLHSNNTCPKPHYTPYQPVLVPVVAPAAHPPLSQPPNHGSSSGTMTVPTKDLLAGIELDYNCNQIRTRINTFIKNSGIKISEFQDALNVTPSSYQLFMKQSGPHAGANSETYRAAHIFFKAREQVGLKQPTAANKPKPKALKSKTDKDADTDQYNADSMPKLDGELYGAVSVYDTCNDVRTKIRAHLRRGGITQAAFARELSKCAGDGGIAGGIVTVSSKNVTDFLNKRGQMAGNTSKAFYAAYVYFEKLRLKENKPKSKKRGEMEVEWGFEGVPMERDLGPNARFWMRKGQSASIDKHGKLQFFGP